MWCGTPELLSFLLIGYQKKNQETGKKKSVIIIMGALTLQNSRSTTPVDLSPTFIASFVELLDILVKVHAVKHQRRGKRASPMLCSICSM